MVVVYVLRGWGWITYPVMVGAVLGGIMLAISLFPQLFAEADGSHNAGVPLGGVAAGVIVGGLALTLIGLALNLRRAPGGGWRSTDRHRVADVPMQRRGRGIAIAGVFLLPLALAGFVPTWLFWVVFLAWALAGFAVTARLRS